jgi:hypothetical protein
VYHSVELVTLLFYLRSDTRDIKLVWYTKRPIKYFLMYSMYSHRGSDYGMTVF